MSIKTVEHKSKTSLHKALSEIEGQGCIQYSIVISEVEGKKVYSLSYPTKEEEVNVD